MIKFNWLFIYKFLSPKTLTANKVGIDNKNEIFASGVNLEIYEIINNEYELKSIVNGSEVLTAYPSIGYEKDKLSELKKLNKIHLKYLYDSYDLLCWPYAKSGFFKFKNKIGHFIK